MASDRMSIASNAVLECEDSGRFLQHRRKFRRGSLDVVKLDHEQHDIDRSNLFRVICGINWIDRDITERTHDAQAVLADRIEVGTPAR